MIEALQQEEYRNEREHIRLLDDEEEFMYQPPQHYGTGYLNASLIAFVTERFACSFRETFACKRGNHVFLHGHEVLEP